MENIKALLEAAGAGFNNVARTTVFMVDLAEFAAMNEVYLRYFTAPYPGPFDRAGGEVVQRRARRDRRHCGA